MNKCSFKCDDFKTDSLTEMVGYILSQNSPEDIIAAWYYLNETMPCLSAEINGEDVKLGDFCLGDLLVLYRHCILSEEIYHAAYLFVDDFLIEDLCRAGNKHMPMLNTSVSRNNFHIDLIWED